MSPPSPLSPSAVAIAKFTVELTAAAGIAPDSTTRKRAPSAQSECTKRRKTRTGPHKPTKAKLKQARVDKYHNLGKRIKALLYYEQVKGKGITLAAAGRSYGITSRTDYCKLLHRHKGRPAKTSNNWLLSREQEESVCQVIRDMVSSGLEISHRQIHEAGYGVITKYMDIQSIQNLPTLPSPDWPGDFLKRHPDILEKGSAS